jgi:hypothetical protein
MPRMMVRPTQINPTRLRIKRMMRKRIRKRTRKKIRKLIILEKRNKNQIKRINNTTINLYTLNDTQRDKMMTEIEGPGQEKKSKTLSDIQGGRCRIAI